MMASTTFWLSTSGLSSVATRSRLAKPYPSICIQTVGFGVLLGFFSASCFSTRCRHSVPACFCMCRCSACTRVPTAPPSRKRSRTSPSEHNTPRRCAALAMYSRWWGLQMPFVLRFRSYGMSKNNGKSFATRQLQRVLGNRGSFGFPSTENYRRQTVPQSPTRCVEAPLI